MKRALLLAALALAPVPAFADDASYCNELSTLAVKYLNKSAQGRDLDLDISTAIQQCQRGNYAPGIATLEAKLRANKFTLPAR
jgi:hypothetical protein